MCYFFIYSTAICMIPHPFLGLEERNLHSSSALTHYSTYEILYYERMQTSSIFYACEMMHNTSRHLLGIVYL